MAKDDNLKLIQEIYSAYAQGNSQFILDRITEDVDWINEGPNSIPYAGSFKGPKDVQRFFEALATSVDNGRVTAEDWITQRDKVVSTGRFTGTVKATGSTLMYQLLTCSPFVRARSLAGSGMRIRPELLRHMLSPVRLRVPEMYKAVADLSCIRLKVHATLTDGAHAHAWRSSKALSIRRSGTQRKIPKP
jgi:uncharacterized protein